MGIADFFRPKHRHSDVRVRTEAVKALTHDDAAILVQIARSDSDIGVRRLALERIDEASVLAELRDAQSERSLKDFAGERAAQLWQSAACSEDPDDAGAALTGMIKLGDQHSLVDVVVMAQLPAIRKRAFGELRDPRALAALAKSDAPQDLRTAAVSRIDDGDVLRALAIDTTQKEVGLAAVEKIDDKDRLENVAQKAKNKAIRQKARKIVTEIEEAERAKKPGVPDEVKRKRAERAQLLREVEGVVETFDFAKASELVRKAEAAYKELGEPETEKPSGKVEGVGGERGPARGGEIDDRFAKAVERFWRRKEIHEQTARGSDELRAIEREAAASKARAAAERAAAATTGGSAEGGAKSIDKPVDAPADDYVRELAPDPKREAREAEAKARRDDKAKLDAEFETRRQAQAAERAAKQKEDAERGVAVAASLKALCDDMEQLADAPKLDTRAIDRLLAQATKAFENVGKIPAADRDTIAERYRASRGKLVTKAGELREAEDWERWANVPKAEALIETAKQMFAAEATPDLGNRLRGLQALWKEVGPMPQRRSKELWDTFKVACDQVYEKVKGVRAVEDVKFAEVTTVKEALIGEAEGLAESSDWVATAEKLKALQAQWKQSGHLPRKQGDELWKRFRAACDKFFERRKPMLDAQQQEESANLQRKHALIARAQAVADKAPGEGGWGKAIGTIKDLQREWKDVGFVPRRDADAVYRAFRAACDALFAKRDAARDGEANAHRAELDGVKAEIAAVIAGGDDVVGRAIAVRAKVGALDGGDSLAPELDAMVRHVLANHADAVKGTELDPAQLHAKRDKLIARVEELMPKQPAAPAGGDVAAQLKAAMRQNAFGDLRFSGRDPIEVLDDLKRTWAEIGPILTDDDHEQAERFEAAIGRVLEANGRPARHPDAEAGEGGRRRRRDRSAPPVPAIVQVVTGVPAMPEPSPLEVIPDAAGSAFAAIASPDDATALAPIPIATHDAITQPASFPPEAREALPATLPVVVAAQAAEPPRRKSLSSIPPMEELDSGWDLGDEDPTKTAPTTEDSPGSLEMAGDGSTEGDGLDSVD